MRSNQDQPQDGHGLLPSVGEDRFLGHVHVMDTQNGIHMPIQPRTASTAALH